MGWWGRKRFETHISALVPRLYTITYSWGCTRDISEDLVQETVTTALDKIDQLRDPKALEFWVIRILVNVHRQHLRKRRGLTPLEDDQLIDEYGPWNQLESSRTVDRVRSAIDQLSDEHRKVLVLVDMEGMSYREVADVLDIKIGTVMSRLGRARNRLRSLLSDEDLKLDKPASSADGHLRRVK